MARRAPEPWGGAAGAAQGGLGAARGPTVGGPWADRGAPGFTGR